LASVVFDTLDEFDIKEKFFCITSDSAANNIRMVKELSMLLETNCDIHWDWKTHHIPCLVHIINLVVQRFLKTLAIKHDDNEVEDFTTERSTGGDTNCDDQIDVTIDNDDFDTTSFGDIISKIHSINKSI